MEYSLTQDLSTQYLGEWAEGGAGAGLWLENYQGDYVGDWAELWNEKDDGDSNYWEDSGTLTVTQSFEEGDEGDFYIGVSNYADVYSPVPEPATMLLLGSG